MTRFIEAFLSIIAEAGIWLVAGFAVAGLLHAFISKAFLARHLGKRGAGSVFKATLVGIPMPLCSCSVIPAAASLRQGGASKGASAAFAVSTPEIDVPAASLTWALLGPVMAIARVISSAVSAVVAGVLIDATDKSDSVLTESDLQAEETEQVKSCCHSESVPQTVPSFGQRLVTAVRYAFITLPADLLMWLLIGFAVSAAVTAFVPEAWLSGAVGTGILAILIAMGFGLIVYVCATGSTPMAAALVAKGLGPGAALAFLLAGPATNPATMAWILKDLGAKALAVYLASIGGVAIASGMLLNWILAGSELSVNATAGHAMGEASAITAIGGAVLMAMMTFAAVRKLQAKLAPKPVEKSCCSSEPVTLTSPCCSGSEDKPGGGCCG
ncbi:MAG: SO_0444 family Cu/Zn efflux transporter [Phycisphaerales bacterium]